MLIEVGKPLFPGRRWPEGVIFEYTESGPMLILAFNNPTPKEIECAKTGQIEMGYYEYKSVIFICVKIQGCGDWMDAPFSIRLYENKIFDWSDPVDDGKGLGIQIIMLDALTGIVKSIRLIGATTEFSRGLRKAIMRQYEQEFNEAEYHRQINEIYRNYSSSDLAKRASCLFRVRRL